GRAGEAFFPTPPGPIRAGPRLDTVSPPSGSNRITNPTPAAPPQAVPPASPSRPAGTGERVAHPVAIRLIPVGQPPVRQAVNRAIPPASEPPELKRPPAEAAHLTQQ